MNVGTIFSGAQRLLPDAAVTGPHQRTELEIGAGRVLGCEADIGLHRGNLPLVHDEHGNELDRDQERIEIIGAVEQWIVLQADAATVGEEGLEILIVVVAIVLARENCLDEVAVLGLGVRL
jgi:hypothetical protein